MKSISKASSAKEEVRIVNGLARCLCTGLTACCGGVSLLHVIYLTTILQQALVWLGQFCRTMTSFYKVLQEKKTTAITKKAKIIIENN